MLACMILTDPRFILSIERCSEFISTFVDPSLAENPIHQKKKYMCLLVSFTSQNWSSMQLLTVSMFNL